MGTSWASIAIPKVANTREKGYIAAMESDRRNLPAITVGTGNWHGAVTHIRIASPFTCGVGVNTTNPVVSTAIEGEPACR